MDRQLTHVPTQLTPQDIHASTQLTPQDIHASTQLTPQDIHASTQPTPQDIHATAVLHSFQQPSPSPPPPPPSPQPSSVPVKSSPYTTHCQPTAHSTVGDRAFTTAGITPAPLPAPPTAPSGAIRTAAFSSPTVVPAVLQPLPTLDSPQLTVTATANLSLTLPHSAPPQADTSTPG
ncbi:uncharacterized protein LOC127007184 [Eriocheir sinensis]|uniref:uncharacterized protein LOC127007184 n=1 Tax=Eriocheir sinensis TaxID=95602 RepID=UPI0021CA7187|nr:uncharacterized protein LOC127007184 [Eriocheir sinensis]